MRKQGMEAARSLLPLVTGALLMGCASAYPELTREIDAAVAAARPTAADSAAAANVATAGTTPGAAGTTTGATTGTTTAAQPAATGSTSSPVPTGLTPPTNPVTPPPGASVSTGMPMGGGATAGMRVTSIANLPSPEAVVIDTAGGFMLVAGSESAAAGSRGVIMRLDLEGTVRDARWIVGGLKGAVLRAPRGMAIVADTLWVADGTILRAFHRRTGRPVVSIPLAPHGAVALSDVAVGGDTTIYVVDAAVTYTSRGVAQRQGTGRIFRIIDRKPTVAVEHARLVQPTGVSWDPITARLLIGSAANDTIMGWRPGMGGPETVAVGSGPWSDVAAIGGMVFYAVNPARGEVMMYANGTWRRVAEGVRGAGDIAVDARRNRVMVPLPGEQRVEIWEVRR